MITIKSEREIKIMAEGGKILADIMKKLEKMVRPGITTKELDKVAEDLVLSLGGRCSFKGYENYPACLCASINEEIVHTVPSERILKESDIISLDLGIFYKGYHIDMAVTLSVGEVSPKTKKLISVTKKALMAGIEKVRPGNFLGDVSRAIQKCAEEEGFNVVKDLCGHGIGRKLHEEPEILNYGEKKTSFELIEGMVFCLEPMVTVGDWHIKKSSDGFAYQTRDGSLSCHFEHTVAVTKSGCQVLTEFK